MKQKRLPLYAVSLLLTALAGVIYLAASGKSLFGSEGAMASAAEVSRQSGSAQVQAPMFEVDMMWPKPLPNHWILGSVVGVAVDSRDHVFIVNRGDTFAARTEIGLASDPPGGECCLPAPRVLEFDPEGNLVASWGGPGQGYDWPTWNNRIEIDPQGNVWIGGNGGTDAQILKFARDGRFIAQYGRAGAAPAAGGAGAADTAYAGVSGAGRAAAAGRGGRGGRGGGRGAAELPGNSTATDAFGGAAGFSFDAATGEMFIADGYRNRRVAVLDMSNGSVKRFWGAYGRPPVDNAVPDYAPGAAAAQQFRTPVHCVELANDGLLYVCDRTSNRIQVFRKDGSFVKEAVIKPATLGEGAVWDIAFSRDAAQRYMYVADGSNMKVHILDRETLEILTSFGDGGRIPGAFLAVHSIATDSRGNIYTAETYEGKRVQRFVFKGVGPVTSKDQGILWPRR